MSSFPSNSSNSVVDNILLETLMERLQVRNPVNNSLVSQSLEDYLYGDFEDDREIIPFEEGREERELEREIIRIIVGGRGNSLMPNSGQVVSVLGHSICVGYKEDDDGDYMVWEWHGHITAYTDQYGYSLEYISPEYVYGSYTHRNLNAGSPRH